MWTCVVLVSIALGPEPGRIPNTAADVVTLRDGKVALGQIVEPSPRGKVVLLIRRSWAQANLPDWARRWEAAESIWAPRARRERRERLIVWKRERAADTKDGDALSQWIDREIDRLADSNKPAPSTLMAVQLSRTEVKSVTRKPPGVARMLRQGWLARFDDVETLSLDDLKQALEGRGFALGGDDPAAVDSLLPVMPEPEPRWLVRRAATELSQDSGLRFVRYNDLILPEGPEGAAAGVPALLSSLKSLLQPEDGAAEDPMTATFHAIAARGRVGLVVTQLDLAQDVSSVRVESTLWVRHGRDRWVKVTSGNASVRPDALNAAAGEPLAADPQVKEAFKLVESLGLGPVPDGVREKSLNFGAATQRALGQAREGLQRQLEPLALPLSSPNDPPPAKPKA